MTFAVLMIGVKSSGDPRAGIQNGFWGIKFLIVIAGMIGAFFIPNGTFGKMFSSAVAENNIPTLLYSPWEKY